MTAFGNLPRLAMALAFLLISVSCKAEQATAQKQYPPPGRLVDVGGYRIHINCAGSGGPTVMIVGAGYSFDWDLVKPEVAKFTRVCTYDPSGSAWSEPGPLGSKPLIVISIAWDAPEYKKLQAELLALSHNSKQLVADKSGHLVQLDQPEVIVLAISRLWRP